MASPSLLESFAKNERLTAEQVRQMADEVLIEWQLTGEDMTPTSHNKGRFLAHIRAKAQAKRERGQLMGEPLEQRRAKFIAECRKLIEQGFDRGEVAEFCKYYSQPTADGRMLFETYKGWDTLTRFQINKKRKTS